MGVNAPVNTSQYIWFIDTGDAAEATYTQVINANTFTPSRDKSTYEAAYKEKLQTQKFTKSTSSAVEMNVDMFEDQAFQLWLEKHEDDVDVPTSLVRVKKNRPVTGTEGAYEAKEAAFLLTLDPIDGEPQDYLKAKGNLEMQDDAWTEGTFNTTTKAFTATVAAG